MNPAVLTTGGVALSTNGEGRPLVLIHGMGSSNRSWHHIVAELEPTRLVVALDMPGFGASPAAHSGFRPAGVAATIVGALANAGIERFDLVGHSLGGMVAAHLADRYPERVRALVLVAPAGLEPRLHLPGRLAGRTVGSLIAIRRELGVHLLGRSTARAAMFGRVVHDTRALSVGDARIVLEASRGAQRIPHGVNAALHGDIRPVLARLRMPVGVIWGAADRLLPASGAQEAARARPGTSTLLLTGCGHLPMIEQPAPLADAIATMLA